MTSILLLGGGALALFLLFRRGGGGSTTMPGALGIYASKPRPCSSFAAAWILQVQGSVPKDPTDSFAWRNLDKSLWDAVNIVDHSQPWSGTAYVQREYSSGMIKVEAGTTNKTKLPTGSWYFVQRWKPDLSAGHAYIVFARTDGKYRVLESSEKQGFRDTVASHWAPSTGWTSAAVALPGVSFP